jgi:hypothetical protein
MRRFYPVLTLAAMLAAFSAAAAAADSPCNLITPQIATAIMGDAVKPGNAMGTACVFSHSEMKDVTVNIQVVGGMGAELFDSIISGNGNSSNEPVPGLGEKASFQISHTESDLYVLVHGKIVTLGVRNSRNPNLKDSMIHAAKAMIGRL